MANAIPADRPLRVAYLSNPNRAARALLRKRALEDLGHQVVLIPTSRVNETHAPLPLWERVARKLGVWPDVTGAGAALVALARRQPLDLIWVDKGLTIRGEHLAQAKAASGAQVVSFSEDDLALAHNRSRRWVEALPRYDLVVTTKIANIEEKDLEALGARRVFYVVQAFDAHQHFPVPLAPDELDAFGADLSSIGMHEAERAASIQALAEAGLSVRVWGPGWEGKLDHPKVRLESRWVLNTDQGLDYSKVLTASKIGLGFLRKRNRDQHTSRTLEIPACGSMLLAERTPVHQAMFEEGVEAEFFGSDEELVAKARAYLADEDRRRAVAAAGYARCLRDYSSTRQMTLILQALGLAPAA